MTYGQLIDESLSLAGVDISKKSDPCYSDYNSMINGVICRAFADIEMRNILPLSSLTVKFSQWNSKGDKMSFDTNNIEDLANIAGITSAGEDDYGRKIDYYYEDSHTIVCCKNECDIRITYYPKPTMPKCDISHDTLLSIPDGICSIIPYFVAGELLLGDEPSLANYLKNRYELMISRFSTKEGRFASVSKDYSYR